ncbi:unnamed protein product [Prorocentrum cordatum]|uniref:Uncharacterized protein n=1 Tax=Prorocentrum cordatum TaxID=2364126 RepID=A0ABN9SX44_9DINO|nr:unnamed protein product [Polarella glacialis]
MGAATAALSWLRPPATIVRGAPTPGSRRRRRTRLVAATTGGAVGQIRAAANRVGVGIAADGRPIGLEWGSQPMEHLLDAFACTSPVPSPPCRGPKVATATESAQASDPPCRSNHWRGSRTSQGSGQSGWSGDRSRWSTCWMRSLARAHAPRPPCRSNHWRGSRTNQDSGQSGWSGDRSPPCRGPKVATATESAKASDPPCRSNRWRGSRTSQDSGQSGWSGDRSRWSTRWMRSPPERPSPPRGAAAPGPPRRSRPRQRRSPPLRGLRRSRPPARSTPACREP